MNDSLPLLDDEHEGARCPIPVWALRPLAILLPLLALATIFWFLLR
ncbi:MAG: hypothetical protein LC793_11670 [Thermomicrobia bacterium]|nr:hypothetical protein [Thermomicrobia bacterium]